MPSPRLNGFNLHYERAGQGPAVVYIRSVKAQEAVRQFIKEVEQNR